MEYAIVYSSKTGNTKLLAETIRTVLPKEKCIYFGEMNEAALKAERIYVGFWTDKGSCDERTAEFLKKVRKQKIYLFGTAGFGGSQEYFDQLLTAVRRNLDAEVKIFGSFICQGKMPMSVRERYVKMQNESVQIPNIQAMIDNFDQALSHPDEDDLENLKKDIIQKSNEG